MAELGVDQSNLPFVQEVCQTFAVLEDGALAHNLQEQEIEQYYSSNVQRNQLVQNDIRVAKRLQDEEQRRAQDPLHQTTQQLEEQDSEYARRMQEEIQRRAEEALRREKEDEEIAKRIQEEEELLVRQQSSCQRTDSGGNTSSSASTLRPARPLLSDEEVHYDWTSHGTAYAPSPSTSDYEDHCERRQHGFEDFSDHAEQRHQRIREPPCRTHLRQDRKSSVAKGSHLGQDSRSSVSQNNQWLQNTRGSESQSINQGQDHRSSARQSSHLGQDRRSSVSQSSRNGHYQGGWGDVVRLIKNDLNEQGYLSCSSDDELFEPVYRLERILSKRQQTPDLYGEQGRRLSRHSSVSESSSRTWQGECIGRTQSFRGTHYSDSRSVRSENRGVRRYNSSCSDSRPGSGQRHVHFQEDALHHNSYSDSQRAFEGSHGQARVSHSVCYNVNPYPVRGEYPMHPIPGNGIQYQAQPQGFQQSAQVRNIYHGDVQVARRTSSSRRNSQELQQANGVRHFESPHMQESRVIWEEEERERQRHRVPGEFRRRAHSLREAQMREGREIRHYNSNRSERRVWEDNEVETSGTEEEERERERRRARRLPQRSLSLSYRGRSPRAGPVQRENGAFLDLGELEQVLLDEELAHKLQEEEKILRNRPYPEGDFKVAQVAQDEEIARYMQKQEIMAKRQSQEMEGSGMGREHGEMNSVYDDRAVYDTQVQRVPRERLDSEGLLSPTEQCSPENQPPSPIATAVEQHQFRNIAEELDPTFHRKDSVAGPCVSELCRIPPTPQDRSCDQTHEPPFVAPTKRQNDKPIQVKSKEKKENCKPKENCKQQ
ncbi:coiled-coil domain-containing protein 187 [Hoplias malabaricus]|uniref:coiled-coil domain-containing protein 187 n=1 Tax=Hoplias malabaricus TaxID=27720 RepID=UPI0034621258